MNQDPRHRARILHTIRLLGFADSSVIADRAGIPHDETVAALQEARSRGWAQDTAFADLQGWSLTEAGRAENERELARERTSADPEGRIAAVYREFLPLNGRLVRACTDWQIRPTADSPFAPNTHTDPIWDRRVLAELGELSEALSPLVGRLTAVLERFSGYDVRFEAALNRAQRGEYDWVDKTHIDSCHRVWFQLHEDLIATLGIDRGGEQLPDG
ncbi:transcriptional regulator [Kocuria coralli]|uniref:Transcriptional regulator n=1 Tax=Kocuria coralli TaxID=1461025 RepID=A0A5J5KXR7_9MICC|nr:transcriptional regulator [Kocuria coralli]KAA9393685.1 transcriptional regulator [Kocuria coralli]